MRTVFFIVIGLICLTGFARADALPDAEVRNLLARIRENRITQADFQEERIIHLMKKPILSSGRVWFQPPNKFRREVKGSSPSLTVSDGHQLWIYYPNFKSAEHYPLGKRSPLDSTVAAINSALNLENVENTFQIAEPSVSSHHCELNQRGGDVFVKDLSSTNGTFINGEKITEAILKPGQILRLGQVEIRLESGAAAAPGLNHASDACKDTTSPTMRSAGD